MDQTQKSLNLRHVKVLLRKDFLTLKRNWMFFLTFLILPIAIMSGFNFIESLVEGELAPERHNLDRKSVSLPNRSIKTRPTPSRWTISFGTAARLWALTWASSYTTIGVAYKTSQWWADALCGVVSAWWVQSSSIKTLLLCSTTRIVSACISQVWWTRFRLGPSLYCLQ